MRVFLQFCAAIAVLMLAQAARAEDFPARPVKILVGAPAGGTTDTMARAIADPMAAAIARMPPSPAPFAPSGLIGEGSSSMRKTRMFGKSGAVGIR